VHGGRAYVVNQLGLPNITAFRIGTAGQLTPLPGTRFVPGGVTSSPADIAVSPDGNVLVVTEKVASQIDLFPLTNGAHVVSVPSNGPGSFGIAFGASSAMLIVEAMNSTISSYAIQEGTSPSLQTITDSLPDTGGTACWIVTSPAGDFAYVINSMTRTISSLSVSPTGALGLVSAVAANMGPLNGPIDAAITHDGKFLYILSSTTGLIAGFSVSSGTLTPLGLVTGLPLSIQGIAAW
jgi:6-phosphogluconolactonase